MLKMILVLTLFVAAPVFAAEHAALKAVPAAQLAGIKITGCEEKPDQSTVTCRSTGNCTITIVTGRVSCKGVKK